MGFIKANFVGGWIDNGSTRDYRTRAVFLNADADAVVDYFYSALSKTVTAACSCVAPALGTEYKLVTVTEPGCNIAASPSPHEAVIADLDTIQDALFAMNATIATANAAAATYASGKIDYTAEPV